MEELENQLFQACLHGNIEIVKLLLNEKRSDANKENKYGDTPLFCACQNGHIEVVKLLLNDQRVDVNKGNRYGSTPLWIACYGGHNEVVKLLLNDKRVDVNKPRNYCWETPFFIACCQGHVEIVKLLLNDERVDIKKANKNDETPFLVACQLNQMKVIKLLLDDKRVNINQETIYGETPLYFASCFNPSIKNVRYLLASKKEVNFHAKIKNGQTAIDLAREKEKELRVCLEGLLSRDDQRPVELIFRKKMLIQKNIVELLESFEKNPNETRSILRVRLGIADEMAASIFATMVLLSDDFLDFKQS